jgi:signal transduction histidine kinase
MPDAQQYGRRAFAAGVGVLEITTLHHKTLTSVLAGCSKEERQKKIDRAAQFLADALTPYEAALQRAHEADALVRGINDRVEQEARRIAHTLHDEAEQMLASAQIAFEDFVRTLPCGCGDCAQLENALLPLRLLEEELRQIAHELRPIILDDLGLIPALKSLAAGVTRRRKIEVFVHGSTGGRLSDPIETALYRVVQAALNNICRHAKANRAEVKVSTDGASVHCVIRDDGVGFDVAQTLQRGARSGLGLIGILERIHAVGGNVRIESAPGHGTELIVVVPVVAAHNDSLPRIGTAPNPDLAVRSAHENARN